MSSLDSNLQGGVKYHRGLHLLACGVTAWAFLVVILGATVKSNEAGLSIPEGFILHWVNQWWEIPNYKLEYFHRMLVGVLSIGVLAQMFWTLAVESRPAVRRFSVFLVLGVVFQALLGYLTVTYFAHWKTSIPHATIGQMFFAATACMATALSPSWTSPAPMSAETESPALQKLAYWLVITVVIQVILGGAIRHDDHGKALVAGRDVGFYTHLVVHILGAVALTYYLARVLFRVFKSHRQLPEILRPARLIMMLLGVQLVLGTLAAIFKVVYSRDWMDADMPPPIRVWTATLHVAVGSLILALSAVLMVRAHRYLIPLAARASSENNTRGSFAEATA